MAPTCCTGVPVRKTVKLVTIWSAEGQDEEGTPVREKGSISYDQLDEGKIRRHPHGARRHPQTSEPARQCVDYIRRNREGMRYPEFRAQGLCVSSGVVEAGCKTAIGVRCKRAGMHWTVAGRQHHHRPTLLHPQQPLRGLLGAPVSRSRWDAR